MADTNTPGPGKDTPSLRQMNSWWPHAGRGLLLLILATTGGCQSKSQEGSTLPSGATTETRFEDIPFMRYSTALRAEVLPMLEALRRQLRANSSHGVHLIGYAYDSLQAGGQNQSLAQARVEQVARWLTERGVSPGQLTTEVRGDRNPEITTEEPAARRRGNRVAIEYRLSRENAGETAGPR